MYVAHLDILLVAVKIVAHNICAMLDDVITCTAVDRGVPQSVFELLDQPDREVLLMHTMVQEVGSLSPVPHVCYCLSPASYWIY